jgi:hypothetical protein
LLFYNLFIYGNSLKVEWDRISWKEYLKNS